MIKHIAATVLMLALSCFGAVAQSIGTSTINGSVVIATGNTFQTVLTAPVFPVVRHSLTIANNNVTDSCWIYIGSGTATKGTSILLLAGAQYVRNASYIPSDAIQATCATSADTLYIDTQ